MTKEYILNHKWKFKLGKKKDIQELGFYDFLPWTKAGTMAFGTEALMDEDWKCIDLPYDWAVDLSYDNNSSPTHGFKRMGRGAFFKSFILNEEQAEKNIYIEFEGIRGESIIYINGIEAKRNRCGYNGFWFDITPYIKAAGEVNYIYVDIDASRLEGWWYEGAGIYRDVKLHIKDQIFFGINELYIRPECKGDNWEITAEIPIVNTGEPTRCEIELILKDLRGNVLAGVGETQLCDNKNNAALKTILKQPKLWSPEEPNLYLAVCRCTKDGICMEEKKFRFGCRTMTFDVENGMKLNGKPYRIKGICAHQDHGGVGIGLSKSLIRYRMEKIKGLGINAYRSAHHPVTPYLFEVCDELGIFVLDENRNFSDSLETMEELRTMVLYARNHPSLLMYSLYNEEPLQREYIGKKITENMVKTVKALDNVTKTTAALLYEGKINDKNASEALDISGFNYMMERYEEYHSIYPDKVILGTENGLVFATRGIYKTDDEKQFFDNSGENLAYGENGGAWGIPFQETVDLAKKNPYVIGLFIWCAFDYRGEPAPYYGGPSVSSHWGIMDLCGIEKDTAYIVKSLYSNKGVLHIVPNISKGIITAFTNCESVTFIIDGKMTEAVKTVRNNAQYKCTGNVKKIVAVATYNNEDVADSFVVSDKKYCLKIENVTPKVKDDVFILNISAVDKNGNFVSQADDIVELTVENGEILGMGNGNPTDRDDEKCGKRRLFNGMCQAIIRAKKESLLCTARSEKLREDKIIIKINTEGI